MEVRQIRCDNCEKTVEKKKGMRTPDRWFRIERIKLIFRCSMKEQVIPDKNIVKIDSSIDPDFCSKKCLMDWFERRVDDISKK